MAQNDSESETTADANGGSVKADAARSTEQDDDMPIFRPVVLPDGGTPTVPREDALDAAEFHVRTADGEQWRLVVVGSDSVEADAYVNGSWGGTKREYTCEGDDPDGLTHVFYVTVEAEQDADTATVSVYQQVAPDEEQDLDVTDVRVETNDSGDEDSEGVLNLNTDDSPFQRDSELREDYKR